MSDRKKKRVVKERPPRFDSEDEERDFWAEHDVVDGFEWDKSVEGSFPALKPSMNSTQKAYRPGGPIVLVSYDVRWRDIFQREAATVTLALGEALIGIHHIGSTAIPGIAAKPVIDILAVVTDLGSLDARVRCLEELGYEGLGEFGIKGRRYFRKDSKEGARTHQIHAFATGSPEIDRHLAFRDYLRGHSDEARRYARLKQNLASRFGSDGEAYSDGKTEFIREIERRAAADNHP